MRARHDNHRREHAWGSCSLNWKEYDRILLSERVSPLLGRLYCYLRRNMDIHSCIVGDADKKLISYQGIREHLEYFPPPGSHERPTKVSRDKLKRMLARLVELGALRRLPGQRYGIELRFFLPLAVSDSVRSQEERHRSATPERHTFGAEERHSSGRAVAGFQQYERHSLSTEERHTKSGEERHTSDSITLSLINTPYTPDDDDWRWLNYMGATTVDGLDRVDVKTETEKFNLRRGSSAPEDFQDLRSEWRFWMLRALEFQEAKQC